MSYMQKNFVTHLALYQHMDIHSNCKWERCFISRTANMNQSGENHNHEAVLVDLTKCLSGWNVTKKKRNCLGSRPVNMEYDEEVCAAAEILMLMANDYFSNVKQPKTNMQTQMDIEAARMCIKYVGAPWTTKLHHVIFSLEKVSFYYADRFFIC